MKIHTGIVLRLCASSDITILDKERGKIVAKMSARNTHMRASNGALISYILKERGSSYTIDIVDLEHIPFTLARHDIFFLHHILELCYYFLPMGCKVEDVFDFLVFLSAQQLEVLQQGKQVIIARLCYMFGLYPDGGNVPDCIDIIIQSPLECLLEIPVNAVEKKWLDQWIWSCIMEHPFRERFKTIGLLKRANAHGR